MRFKGQPRRFMALAVALFATAAVLFGASAATAGPIGVAVALDPDGAENKTLREQLDAAARGYLDAKTKLDTSKALEASLNERMSVTRLHIDLLTDQVSLIAASSYRTGRLGPVTALLEANSPDDLLQRMAGVERLAMYNDSQLGELRTLRRQMVQQQDRLYAELQQQATQVATMEKRKLDAEKALAATGGGRTTGGFVAGNSPAAKPAPRNADGSWPTERCTVDDPTTSGCLTPRTHHAYQQTKTAGFTRYVSCHRSSGSGEHPKGRACDWAAQTSGFGGVASGGDKTYGDKLASWYVANASRLGIMYVIWYKQIWMPGLAWRSYSGDGSPAGNHTNHVHLSMY